MKSKAVALFLGLGVVTTLAACSGSTPMESYGGEEGGSVSPSVPSPGSPSPASPSPKP
jgi:hypothetical protein